MELSKIEKLRWVHHRKTFLNYSRNKDVGIGSKTSPERKKQIITFYREYPSITYVQKKLQIDRKIVKAVLEQKGLF